MRFEITFHTPFRVGSGQAGDGSDTTVDRQALLPASSLKGVIKSAARDLLKFPDDLVEGIFGTEWQPSPWAWSDARVLDADGSYPAIRPRARIQIEPGSMTVTRGALLVADEVLAARAEFSIDQAGWIRPGDVGTHEAVLLAAARAVTAIGNDRRRGLGWVTVTPVNPSWSDAHLQAAVRLTQAARATAGESGQCWRRPVMTENGALRVSVLARQRLALGVGSEVSYFTGTHPFVPGSVLRGALAAAWIAEYGPPAAGSSDEARFRDLFDGHIRYGALHVPGTGLVPVSAWLCKYPKNDSCARQAVDAAFEARGDCPACGGPMQQGKGQFLLPDGMALDRITRTSIDPKTAKAKDGELYAHAALPEGTQLSGLIHGRDSWLEKPRRLRLGGRRTVGGAAEYEAVPAGAGEPAGSWTR